MTVVAAREHHASCETHGLVVDENTREVFLSGELITLTRTEFDLLVILQHNPRRVLTPDVLLTQLWNSPFVDHGHPIEVYVHRLRRKLGESAREPRYIHTVRGVGYRFEPDTTKWGPVVITYDANLIVLSVTPGDRPFLGWKPDNIIGTCFKITSLGRSADTDDLITTMRTAFETGARHLVQNSFVFDGEGQEVAVTFNVELLEDESAKLIGLRLTLSPLDLS